MPKLFFDTRNITLLVQEGYVLSLDLCEIPSFIMLTLFLDLDSACYYSLYGRKSHFCYVVTQGFTVSTQLTFGLHNCMLLQGPVLSTVDVYQQLFLPSTRHKYIQSLLVTTNNVFRWCLVSLRDKIIHGWELLHSLLDSMAWTLLVLKSFMKQIRVETNIFLLWFHPCLPVGRTFTNSIFKY